MSGVQAGRDVDAFLAEGGGDPGAELSAYVELHARQRPGHHAHRERVDLDPFHAHHGGRVEHHLVQPVVVPGLLADPLEYIGDPADLDGRRDRHIDDGPRPVTGKVGHLDYLTVGRDDDLAADRPDAGDPEGDVLDRAEGRLRYPGDRYPDYVAEAVLALAGDEEPGPDVLDEALQAEAERRAEQGGGRYQACQRHAETLHYEDGGDGVHHGQERPAGHFRGDVAMLGRLGAHELVGLPRERIDARHDQVADPYRQPGQQDRPQHQQDDLQQVALRPHLQVIKRSDCARHEQLSHPSQPVARTRG